ncbi:MAG TPA: hypothetical protein VIC33_10465 [Vicinamibacterales bacterium]|jgi:hypothetical protein
MELTITSPENPMTASDAFWNQRHRIAAARERLTALQRAVGRLTDLSASQWAQILAMTLEFRPDLVIELGRGLGNSTCVFTEAVNQSGANGRSIVSVCMGNDWDRLTRPRVAAIVPPEWFAPLQTHEARIETFDFETPIARARRVLVFWDAHGFAVAEQVLARIVPAIAHKPHLVIMHDLSDARYGPPESARYQSRGLWTANDWSGPRLRLGHIDTAVEQAIAAIDFTSRNRITLQSADHSFHTELGADPVKVDEMRRLLGPEWFSLNGHFFYFSLNERSGEFTFPALAAQSAAAPAA